VSAPQSGEIRIKAVTTAPAFQMTVTYPQPRPLVDIEHES
jgi:hypothetical protein